MCSLTLLVETLSLGMLGSFDSSATDHMTLNPNQFKIYSPCQSNRKIVVADGTTTIVAGIGDV